MTDPASLREIYRTRLPVHADALRAAIDLAASGSDRGWDAIRRLAHDLKGTGAAFGFPEITEAARPIGESEFDLSVAEQLFEIAVRCAATGPIPLRTILLVGNDPQVGSLLTGTLGAPGRRILVAESSREATELLAEQAVDLILVDLVLPDEDGRKLLSRLRRMSHTAQVPLLAISPSLGPETEAECYALGADGFFQKPLNAAAIGAAVTARLARAVGARADSPRSGSSPRGPAGSEAGVEGPADVLLVEDDDLTVEVLRHRLERDGFRVHAVSDGLEALQVAAAGPPSLVILDVKLPGLDGFSVLTRLRAMAGWAKIPIVMLTALGAEADLVKAFSLGATDYVLKPFSPGEVTARVRRLLTP